jgi:ABC-2 type transport system permease protein
MTTLRPLASAAAAIFRRDLLLFASYRSRLVTTLFTSVVSLTLFYYVSRLVTAGHFASPDRYFQFVVVGLSFFAVVTATLSGPVATLRSELQAGTFERMAVSPFGPVRAIVSLLLFPVTLALALALFSLAFAIVAFGLDVRWSTVALAIPVAGLAALAFAPFGVAMAAAVVIFKQTNAGAAFVIAAMTLLAGVYFPVELLPGWIRWASEVQPFTPALDLLRNVVTGLRLREPAGVEVAKLCGFAAVTLPVAVLLLRAALETSRRRGTLTEY